MIFIDKLELSENLQKTLNEQEQSIFIKLTETADSLEYEIELNGYDLNRTEDIKKVCSVLLNLTVEINNKLNHAGEFK